MPRYRVVLELKTPVRYTETSLNRVVEEHFKRFGLTDVFHAFRLKAHDIIKVESVKSFTKVMNAEIVNKRKKRVGEAIRTLDIYLKDEENDQVHAGSDVSVNVSGSSPNSDSIRNFEGLPKDHDAERSERTSDDG